MRSIVQVPVTPVLKQNATLAAEEMGFSSLQELIRVLLTKIANKQLSVSIQDQKLSAKNEKRYAKMEEDFKKGKNVGVAHSVEELMRQLHEN